jgi:ABC-type multidrug transport system fused ATPase/permease subunit
MQMKFSVVLKSIYRSSPFCFVISITSVILTALSLISFGFVFNLLVKDDTQIMVIALLGINVLFAIFSFMRSYFSSKLAEVFCNDLKSEISHHALSLNYGSLGDISNKVLSFFDDISSIHKVISTSMMFAVRNIIIFIIAIVAMFFTSIKLASIVVVSSLIIMIIMRFMIKKYKIKKKIYNDYSSRIQISLMSAIKSMTVVKSFMMENYLYEKIHHDLEMQDHQNNAFAKVKGIMISSGIFLFISLILATIIVGINDMNLGLMSNSRVSLFIFYAILCIVSFSGLSDNAHEILSMKNKITTIFEYIKDNTSPIIKLQDVKSIDSITLTNIEFSYDARPLISNLSFVANRGDRILLRGKSGSGKTTIMHLLLKYYDLQGGKILINDNSLSDISDTSIRKLISTSQQVPYAIEDESIKFNITLTKKIENKARFDDIIECLNLQKVLIKNETNQLSTGEMLRISIARAIYKKADVYIFDEPTSNIDQASIDGFVSLVEKYCQDSIIIIMSHDTSIEKMFNKIIHLG